MDETSPIGKCFQKERTLQLDQGVKAHVYFRIKEFTAYEVTYLRDYFAEYYPESPELFTDRIETYLSCLQ